MKQTTITERRKEVKPSARLAKVCLACGQKIAAQINRAKEAILTESAASLATHRHALRLALNEAEALAWQTLYPHLVFPALAAEKVQAVAAWDARQRVIRRNDPLLALAA